MDKEKLSRLDVLMNDQLKNGVMTGGTLCVIKDGEQLYRKNFGMADTARKIPVRDNTIFRLYSMTKPITAAATMILYDRGVIDLYDSVSWYIEGFKNQKVATDKGIVPVNRDVNIKDLLTMTSGLVYPDRGTPAGDAMSDLFDEYYKGVFAGSGMSTLEICSKIGMQPLCAQPGEIWNYGTSADILGGVIEVVTGKRFGEFLYDEIFEPLGMTDTDFYVPAEKRDRFAEIYIRNEKGGLEPCEWQHLGLAYKYQKPPEFEIGGAGLVSTVSDYAKFAQMLLNGGVYKGRRILSEHAVSLLTTNHLAEGQRSTYGWESCYGCGYGGLMRVLEDPWAAGAGVKGEYGWDGWTGNYFCNDPVNKLTFLYFIQVCGGNGQRPIRTLKQAVYGALENDLALQLQ